jgi:hypothetical protein
MEPLDEFGIGVGDLVSIGGWLIAFVAAFLLLLLMIAPILAQNQFSSGWDRAFKRAHRILLSQAIRTRTRVDLGSNDRILIGAMCPACAVVVPQSRLSLLLIHLYRDHSWTRERIADWLEQSGFDSEKEAS